MGGSGVLEAQVAAHPFALSALDITGLFTNIHSSDITFGQWAVTDRPAQ